MRTKPPVVVSIVLALMLTASTASAQDATSGLARSSETIRVVTATAPDSLDPQVGVTSQAGEAAWPVYTPLLTYTHESGVAGSTLIPGLATALPKVSADGRTYELTLRKGLTFSDGEPVKAGDFAYTIERAIKNNWGEKTLLTNNIEGAEAYDAGKAQSISGISTNDKTGKITIRLTQPFGGFPNVLGLPLGTGLVPSGTPMKNLASDPPPGVGPYKIVRVSTNGGYRLRRNNSFASFNIPGIPTGYAKRIVVRVVPNNTVEAERVLNNEADVFDGGDELPPALVPQIEASAGTRFSTQPSASTFFFFLNTTRPPFNSLKARQAVNTALDRNLLARLTSNFIKPSCFFLPEGIAGHPTGPCPYGETPDLAKARQLVAESGMAGTPVTVWGQERSPRREYADYYTQLLNEIGFQASEKIVGDDEYFSAVGDATNEAQTGFADWFQDFPNPSDFYLVMDARSIQPTGNLNFSRVNDPFIQERLIPLDEVASTQLESIAPRWQALDEYVAQQAYIAPFGEQVVPKFYSDRIDFGRAVFHVLFGNDFATLRLK
jgi:peptide/nickel transport system substrate-binding protein